MARVMLQERRMENLELELEMIEDHLLSRTRSEGILRRQVWQGRRQGQRFLAVQFSVSVPFPAPRVPDGTLYSTYEHYVDAVAEWVRAGLPCEDLVPVPADVDDPRPGRAAILAQICARN